MGVRTPKSIGEYPSFEIDLGVVCRRCGRTAVFDAGEVSMYFYRHNIRSTMPIETRPFRCRCGSRDVETIGVPIGWRPKPLPARLLPIYVKKRAR